MSTLIQPDPIKQVRRQFLKANKQFDRHSAVFQAVSDQLLERLELLNITPAHVLDLGCRTGYQLPALQLKYPQARIVGVDPAPGAAKRKSMLWPKWLMPASASTDKVACDPHELPFPNDCFDLVVSNLLLPWCHSPHRLFEEAARVLKRGGAFMFTTAGPDTLQEYRNVWANLDPYLHSFGLIDMHDLGDTLMASGFAAPVLDRNNMKVDYPSFDALQTELQFVGAANIANGRRKGLTSPSVARKLRALSDNLAGERASDAANRDLESNGENNERRFPVTLELVQGHGWKGDLDKQALANDGEFSIPVDSLRGSWRRQGV